MIQGDSSASSAGLRLGLKDLLASWAIRKPSRTEIAIALCRALILGLAAALLTRPLSVGIGQAAAFLGMSLGMLAAEWLQRAPVRLGAVVSVCAGTALVGAALSRLPVYFELPGLLFGPVLAYELGECLLWFWLFAPFAFAMRFAAIRRPLLALLELLVAAAAFATHFAAHREGMVHRPLAIGDWAWSRGIDPAMILLLLGGGAALLLAALLVSEKHRIRLLLHFATLLVIAIGLFLSVRVFGLPVPDTSGLGLTGDPNQQQAQEQGGSPGDPREGRNGRGKPRDGDKPSNGPRDNEMEFRDDYDSKSKSAPVAVVILHDDYSPPSGVYYFRQSAQSQYNGNKLVKSTRDDVDKDIVRFFPTAPTAVEGLPPLASPRRDLRMTVGLIVDHVNPFAHDAPVIVQPVPNPNPLRFQRAYEVISRVQTTPYEDLVGRRAGSPRWTPEQWQSYTELPKDPRYRELALRVIESLPESVRGDPLARALSIKFHLEKEGTYSLKSRHANAADPAASFLFGDMTGYCVHFAHAATYLFRSLGIPARVAVGYAVPESHRAEGSAIMIRGANAHAWPEIYLEDEGWVVVDLVPENSLDPPLSEPEPSLQSMLGEMMRNTPGETDEYLASQRSLPTLSELLAMLAWISLALMCLAASIKCYRRMIPAYASPTARYRVSYRAAMDQLADVGLRRRHGESRESFAGRLSALAPSFDLVTRQHLAWALGSRHLSDPERLNDACVQIGRELERAVPRWRRTLGWLNPFSWLGVR